MNSLSVTIGPEILMIPDGLQPFMLQTASGRLIAQAQLKVPPATPYPGIYANVVSDDGGATWQPWRQENIPGGSPFYEGCAAQLRDGTVVWLEYAATGPDENGDWTASLWESRDDLRTLQGPIKASFHLPQAKGGFDDDGNPAGNVFFHRSLLELPDGGLLLTAYCWFQEDTTPSTYMPTMNKLRTILLRSDDRGRNWSLVSTVASDPTVGEESFNEPAMVRLSRGPRAGRLICLLRTGSNKTFPHNPIYQTESDDDGRTWSTPHALDFENVDPDIIELSNGVLAASCGWRTEESRKHHNPDPKDIGAGHGNYLIFSFDQGETWTQKIHVTHEPSSCYTAIRETAPGKIVFVYDVGDWWHHVWKDYPDIKRSISCRIIEIN